VKLGLAVDTREGRRRFALLGKSLSDLTPVLREFDKYKRERVQAIFDAQGPGWDPRSQAKSESKKAWDEGLIRQNALNSLRKTLQYDVLRATRRFEKGGRASAMIKREAVLDRFNDMVASGVIDFDALAGRNRKGQVDMRFYRRNPRAITRYANASEIAERLLGKVPQSIFSTIARGLLTIESKIPWAGVHNEGATVGRGAEVPARPFLFWDDVDLGFLVILLREAGLLAMGAA
jgi:hypothetical protein